MPTIIPEVVVGGEPVHFPDNLPETDGIPLESAWHRAAIALLIESVICHRQGQTDYYAGGNMFIYYSNEQRKTDYRGPDFYFVKGVDGTRSRNYWAIWEEGGRYPDVIMELLSPTTARVDRTTKKDLYERTFRTPEYFCYDPATRKLEGWRLDQHLRYQAIRPNERGWLWSEQLGLWVGTWEGTYLNEHRTWVRFYDEHGNLVLTLAEKEHQRAEQERQRAEVLQTEVARLKALFAEQQLPPSGPGTASP